MVAATSVRIGPALPRWRTRRIASTVGNAVPVQMFVCVIVESSTVDVPPVGSICDNPGFPGPGAPSTSPWRSVSASRFCPA
jgi:hypothetical protein